MKIEKVSEETNLSKQEKILTEIRIYYKKILNMAITTLHDFY